jgi:hypothetical protein
MQTVHFDLSDSREIKQVCKAAFPKYRGRKFKVNYDVKTMSVRSYWDGGSKTSYALVRLHDLSVRHAPTSHPVFDHVDVDVDNVIIPDGFVIVGHSIFCGKDMGLTIYTPITAPLLPDNGQVSDELMMLLLATAGLKSSYAGIRDYRKNALMQTLDYTSKQVDDLRQQAMTLGYMAKNKAITVSGRNVIESHPKRMSMNWKTW